MKLRQWMQKAHILAIIGMSGVHPSEPKRARTWGKIFNYIVVFVAIVLLLQWQLEILHTMDKFHRRLINLAVWLFFVLELIVLLFFVKDRWRFLRQNWLLPIIIVLGIAVLAQHVYAMTLLRTVRPILAIVILAPALSLLISFFSDGKLRTTLVAAAIIVVIFGLLVAGIDPNVKSAWEGIWWAVVTVSTVGYGDVVPTSALGRLIGIGLIILGLGIFVVITANFLALVLRKEVAGVKKEETNVELLLQKVKELQDSQFEFSQIIHQVNSKLNALEKSLHQGDIEK